MHHHLKYMSGGDLSQHNWIEMPLSVRERIQTPLQGLCTSFVVLLGWNDNMKEKYTNFEGLTRRYQHRIPLLTEQNF